MSPFTSSAERFVSHTSTRVARENAWARFTRGGLPTSDDEIWRYTPIATLNLDAFEVPGAPSETPPDPALAPLSTHAAMTVTVVDGYLVDVAGSAPGVAVTASDDGAGVWDRDDDPFALLGSALSPSVLTVTVAPGATVEGSLRIDARFGASAGFLRTHYVIGDGARVEVVESYSGGRDALVVALVDFDVDAAAHLDVATVQRLDATCWHVARTSATLARDAVVRQSSVGLGAHYDRSRNDAHFVGAGASNELLTTYLGTGAQIHDFRTHQRHSAPRTRSSLVSKGAVAGSSRSVYTGLIEIDHGAKKTDARQRNHNLILAPTAHADAVPNLDIKENDVACAHASTVGPLDETQRWYLESRGVARDEAARLLVRGFFRELTSQMPAGVDEVVSHDVTSALGAGVLA